MNRSYLEEIGSIPEREKFISWVRKNVTCLLLTKGVVSKLWGVRVAWEAQLVKFQLRS